MIILFDQDGVLADFERGFIEIWSEVGTCPAVDFEDRKEFMLEDDYPLEHRGAAREVLRQPGFFRNLKPFEDAVVAFHEMVSEGYDVRICTSPLSFYRYCVPEKCEWVERHLGAKFVSRMIVTKDKTLVHGHILFDDNPCVEGVMPPSWTHVVVDAPYNRDITRPRIISWKNWRDVVGRIDREQSRDAAA